MKRVLAILLLVGAVTGGYYYYETRVAPGASGNSEILTLYGNVDIRDVALGFRVAGRIASMQFNEGDVVEKRDVLAKLDKRPFIDEVNLRRAELSEAESALRNAEKKFQRSSQLVDRGTVSQSAYDDALAAREAAQARVKTATARLESAKTNLEDTEIHAPESGTVLTRVREPGAIVAAGAPVYTLALEDPVWVRTYVDEPDLGHVFPGQKATISTDTGDEYSGQIGFISPQAEFTPKNVQTTQLRTDLVFRLRVIVDNPDRGLRQGMPVTVTLDRREPGS